MIPYIGSMESASILICMSFFLVGLCPSPVFTIPQERFYPFGSTAGDVSLPRILDVSSPVVPLTITLFPYFGQYHNQLFVSVGYQMIIIVYIIMCLLLLLSKYCIESIHRL